MLWREMNFYKETGDSYKFHFEEKAKGKGRGCDRDLFNQYKYNVMYFFFVECCV